MTPEQEKLLAELQALAQQNYPGRAWNDLSPTEQEAVFQAHQAQREYAGSIINQPAPEGKVVGPSRIYVAPNWGESLAHGVRQALGGYMLGKANQSEAAGRKALSDLQTRRDHLDRSHEQQLAAEEERRRRDWLQAILSRSY